MSEFINQTVFTYAEEKLPIGWALASISDIIKSDGLFVDGNWVESKDQDPKGGVRLIQLADIGDGIYRNKSSRYLTHDKAIELGCTFLKPGDILVARMPEPLGRACIFPGDSKPSVTAVDVCIVRTGTEGMNQRWIIHTINSPAVRSIISSLQSGSTRKRISRSNLAKLLLPIPPLTEQHRIVAKIEELFTKLDAGVAALKKVKVQLKRYRQAVLKSAFEGKLTKKWREAHKIEIEPASVLMERIKEERRKNAKAKYKELPPVDTSDLPELPEGWIWARMGEIVVDVEKVNPKDNPEREFIYLDIASIDNKLQRITNPKQYLGKDAPSRAKQLVKADDILFSTVRTYLKNIAMVNSIYNGQIASTGFCVIRPHSLVNSNLIFQWVQRDFFLNPLTQIQRGTSYPAVRESDVFAQFLPLPPFIEQRKIVEEIERHLSITDVVEKVVEQSLKQAERLRQSILKKAFEGKLVPQDPSDDPAEKLLERIKEEKAKLELEGKTKKKVKKGG